VYEIERERGEEYSTYDFHERPDAIYGDRARQSRLWVLVEVDCDCGKFFFTGKLRTIVISLSPNKSWITAFC
jgi:hypothetical protein